MAVSTAIPTESTWSKITRRFSASSLRRQTSGSAYVPEVDGLRFIAIVSVVLYHVAVQMAQQPNGYRIADILHPVVQNGYRGVQLFFVISGFILGLPFARHRLLGAKQTPLRSYFLRRVTRLEPPYFAIMCFRGVLAVVLLHQAFRHVVPHLLASLVYAHNLIFTSYSTINPPAWSLEIEIQFYILAPLFAWLIFSVRSAPLRRVLLVTSILVFGVLQQIYIGEHTRMGLSILFWVQDFLAGFLLCDLYMVGWESIRSHWLWDAVCLPLWVWVFWWNSEWYRVLLPLACVILYVGAFKGPLHRKFFRAPLIATTGGMCYSIYLTHNLTLSVALHFFRWLAAKPNPAAWTAWLMAAVVTVIALGLGAIFYVVLERPCMERDWPRKLAARLRSRFLPREPAHS